MKKFTVVYNNIYYSRGVQYKHMIVEWVEGEDMNDAMHTHYQSLLDEGMEVEDVIYFEGELNYKTPEEDIEVAA
jgi:hypothetical protein